MTNTAAQLYDWIRIANEARERLDMPVGTIEEAIATLESAFGDTYLGSLISSDEEHGKRIVTARDDRPLAYWLSGPGLDSSVVQLVETAVVIRSFFSDPCLPKKIERIKTDTFWPTFYELAMGILNQNGLPDFPDFAGALEALKEKEITTDPITGWKYQRTWEEARQRADREINELERLRRVNVEGYIDK